jgi:predicted permease
MNVGNIVTYGLYDSKYVLLTSINLTIFILMRFNTFFLKKNSAGFNGISKGSMAQKGLRTPVLKDCAASIIRVYLDISHPLPAYIV